MRLDLYGNIPFGKYHGKMVKTVIEDDTRYFDWYLNIFRGEVADDVYTEFERVWNLKRTPAWVRRHW